MSRSLSAYNKMAIRAGIDSLEQARYFEDGDFDKIAEEGIVWYQC